MSQHTKNMSPLEHANEVAGDLDDLFSVFALISPSIKAIGINIWMFAALIATITVSILIMGVGVIGALMSFSDANYGLMMTWIAIALVALVPLAFSGPAGAYLLLQSAKGKQVTGPKIIRATKDKFWQYYGLTLLVGLIVLGGLILFVIPGIFMLKRYYLSTYYLYDRNLSVKEAMRQSAEEAAQMPNAIWGLMGLYFVLAIASGFPTIGFFASIVQILYYCAPALRYLQIKEAVKE